MTEQAQMVIHGDCCELCGAAFSRSHGHAVVCTPCWMDLDEEDRKHHQQATYRLL